MIKSPSKYSSRDFLRELIENNYISPRGTEYCAEEVNEMFYQKCTDLAEFPERQLPSAWEQINMKFTQGRDNDRDHERSEIEGSKKPIFVLAKTYIRYSIGI